MILATLTNTGRAAIAKAIAARPLHLAWGTGDELWDAEGVILPSLINATRLVNEVGRRTPNKIGFVLPDEAGDIVVPVSIGVEGAVREARYRLLPGDDPSPFVYVRTAYDYQDAFNVQIRELGLFMDTEFIEGLPPGQRYFKPHELANPGLLLAAQLITPPINRSPYIKQSVEFVLPI